MPVPSIQMKCEHCGAKAYLLATTKLPNGTYRRRYECSAHPESHRFTIKAGKPPPKPPAFYTGQILTEWRPNPFQPTA